MAGQTISGIDTILKDFYVDKIVEEIKQEMPLLDYFKKRDDMPTDGRQVFYPVHVGRNAGRGAIAAGGNLPTAGGQTWQDMKWKYKYNYARIQIDAQSLKATKTSKGAFEKIFDAEILGAARDCGRDRNRQLFGDGTGTIAVIKTTANSATQTFKNCQNQTDANGQYNPARFFAANDILAGIASDGSALNWAGTVSSVSSDLTQVTFGSAVNATAGDIVVRVSTAASTALADAAYNNEVMGLLGMIDDATYVTTYGAISRSTYPVLKSTRISLGQAGLTTALLQKGFDGVYQKSDGKITALFLHPVTLREHLANIQTFKRYTNEFAKSPDAGWEGAAHGGDIEFNEAPMEVDRDCPYGVIFGIDEKYLYRYVNEEGKWADEDGTILLRLSSTDAYEARFRVFDAFANDAPNTGFVLDGIGLSGTPETVQVL